ncbi:MAG: 5-oxoprolinase subunit B family protein [Gemmataceae bacterium]
MNAAAVVPLSDQAILIYFPNESTAAAFAEHARRQPAPWLLDVVQAYASVAVFFDLARIPFADAERHVQQWRQESLKHVSEVTGKLHHIPCWYDSWLDMERVMAHTGLTAADVIRWHSETEYTVFAIGFCPGFPYLGYLPPALQGVPRLPQPRLRVEAGSVGLTGQQTGIYTEARPGGWNIIGRAPLRLVDVADGYFPLRTGDRVRFVPISEDEYFRLLGQRL